MEVERAMSSELQALKQELQRKGSHNRPQDEELISAMREQVPAIHTHCILSVPAGLISPVTAKKLIVVSSREGTVYSHWQNDQNTLPCCSLHASSFSSVSCQKCDRLLAHLTFYFLNFTPVHRRNFCQPWKTWCNTSQQIRTQSTFIVTFLFFTIQHPSKSGKKCQKWKHI